MLEEYTEKRIRKFLRSSPRQSRWLLCLPVSSTDAVMSSACAWRQNVGAGLSLHVVHVAYAALLGRISTISLSARRSWLCGCRGSISIVFGVLTSNSLAAGVAAKDVQGIAIRKQYSSRLFSQSRHCIITHCGNLVPMLHTSRLSQSMLSGIPEYIQESVSEVVA